MESKEEFIKRVVSHLPMPVLRDRMTDGEWHQWFSDVYDEGYRKANDYTPVSEQEPPSGVEVLAKSPSGVVHLCHWRPAYNIFTCQEKRESSFEWSWKLV